MTSLARSSDELAEPVALEECRYYLILARDLGSGYTAQLAASAEEVSRFRTPDFSTPHIPQGSEGEALAS